MIRVIPTGGGGGSKDVLRVVAMVGVIALAFAVPYIAAAVLPGALGSMFVNGGLVTGMGMLLTAATAIGGSLAMNARLSHLTVLRLEAP